MAETILITGAGSGIGRETARLFLENGWNVALAGRRAAALEETAHTMTVHRVRHIPITVDGELRAIVSIGDIVKNRIDQLTDERNHLLGYLHT